MNLAKYKLLRETPKEFHLHDGKDTFVVAKSGLERGLAEKIHLHFAQGGEVKGYSDESGDPQDAVVTGYANPDALQNPLTPEEVQQAKYAAEDARSKALLGGAADPDYSKTAAAFSRALESIQDPAYVAQKHAAATPAIEGVPDALAAPDPAQMNTPPVQFSAGPGKTGSASDPFMGGYQKALRMQEQGAKDSAAVQANLGNSIASSLDQQQKDLADLEQQRQAARASLEQQSNAALDAYKAGTIDPNRVWGNASTGQKITASIGLLLGGLGSGLTGSPNLALETINRNIDRDIDAQKSNLNKQGNLFRMNLERLHDSDAAFAMTRLQMLTASQAQIEKAKALAVGPAAQANLQSVLGVIQGQRAQLMEQFAQRHAMAQFLSGGGASEATLAHLPPEEQAKLMKQRVFVAEDRPILRNGQPVIDQSTGQPLTARVASQRFGLDEDSTKKARDAFMENDDLQQKIADLQRFVNQHPHGSIMPSVRQQAADLAHDIQLGFLKPQEGMSRLNPAENEKLESLIKNPAGLWDANTGKVAQSVADLRRMANARRNAADNAFLMPRFR